MKFWKRHKHAWFRVSAAQGESVVGGGAKTLVLEKCADCGALRTDTLNGHWTLDELNAARGR